MVRKADWNAIKQENRDLESYLGEWCVKDEISYLRKWTYDFGEIRAKDLGIESGTPCYSYLHLTVKNSILWQTMCKVSAFLDSHPGDHDALTISLPTYEYMDKMVENLRNIKKPSVQNPEKLTSVKKFSYIEDPIQYDPSVEGAYAAQKQLNSQLEDYLLKFINANDLDSLRVKSFEYADKKAKSYGFLTRSDKYNYLQVIVRHELMREAAEYLSEFSNGDAEASSKIIQGLLQHNDLDMFLREYDSKFRKD